MSFSTYAASLVVLLAWGIVVCSAEDSLQPYTPCRVETYASEAKAVNKGTYGGLGFEMVAEVSLCTESDTGAKFTFTIENSTVTASGIRAAEGKISSRLRVPNFGTALFDVLERADGTRSISTQLVWRDIPQYTVQLCNADALGTVSSCATTSWMPYFLLFFWLIPALLCAAFLGFAAVRKAAVVKSQREKAVRHQLEGAASVEEEQAKERRRQDIIVAKGEVVDSTIVRQSTPISNKVVPVTADTFSSPASAHSAEQPSTDEPAAPPAKESAPLPPPSDLREASQAATPSKEHVPIATSVGSGSRTQSSAAVDRDNFEMLTSDGSANHLHTVALQVIPSSVAPHSPARSDTDDGSVAAGSPLLPHHTNSFTNNMNAATAEHDLDTVAAVVEASSPLMRTVPVGAMNPAAPRAEGGTPEGDDTSESAGSEGATH